MRLVSRSCVILAAVACGFLCTGCAGVIQLDPDQQAAMLAAQQASDLAAAATQTAMAAHMQALADAQRAADAARLAAEAAARALPPIPPT